MEFAFVLGGFVAGAAAMYFYGKAVESQVMAFVAEVKAKVDVVAAKIDDLKK